MFEFSLALAIIGALCVGWILGAAHMRRKIFTRYLEGIRWQHRREEVAAVKRITLNL